MHLLCVGLQMAIIIIGRTISAIYQISIRAWPLWHTGHKLFTLGHKKFQNKSIFNQFIPKVPVNCSVNLHLQKVQFSGLKSIIEMREKYKRPLCICISFSTQEERDFSSAIQRGFGSLLLCSNTMAIKPYLISFRSSLQRKLCRRKNSTAARPSLAFKSPLYVTLIRICVCCWLCFRWDQVLVLSVYD